MAHQSVSYLLVILVVAFGLVSAQQPADPTYDHQTKTYVATTAPVNATGTVTITPFFSPDHSVDSQTALVQSAKKIIRLGIPGFDSWGNCTYATNTTYGCTAAMQRNNESFPIFNALLNALHNGVTVQILTNNYSQPYYPGLIDPLAFLALAGADVRSFTTVTFIHSKYISVDGATAAVSSVNFSKASFMKNREAGLIISNCPTVQEFLDGVFDADFAVATPWQTISYSASDLKNGDMKIIQDTTPIPVVIPPRYVTPLKTYSGATQIEAITSPDLAYTTITNALVGAKDVQLYDMCDYISNHSKIFSAILVSNEIYDKNDYYAAKACYTRLYNQGFTIRKTAEHVYEYSHQKYWIVDKKTLFLSTGNWGGTDYPDGSQTFPPYTSSAWRLTNRDFTIKIVNKDVLEVFQKTLDEDYERGWDWYPESEIKV